MSIITHEFGVQYMHDVLKDITAAGHILRDTVQKDTRPPVKHVNAEEELAMVLANVAEAIERLEFFAQFETSSMQEAQSLAIIIADLRLILRKIK